LVYRVAIAYENAEPQEIVDLNDVIELYLISPLAVREFPHIEQAVPGFSGALPNCCSTRTIDHPKIDRDSFPNAILTL